MKIRSLALAAILLLALTGCRDDCGTVTPNARQLEWADAEIGVLIHFDMPVFRPEYNWREFDTRPDASVFNPTMLDTDQWLETAGKLGAKYAVLVAKHCSGFSLWPTEAHEFSVKNSPWKNGEGDIVRDFIESCHKYGIKPGLYASTSANGYCWVDNPGLVQPGSPFTQEEYNAIVRKQLTELWTNYGELFEIWFDGGVLAKDKGGADVLPLVQSLQSEAIAFQGPAGHPNLIRWVGNEEGVAPYPCWATADATTNADGTEVVSDMNGDPQGSIWCPGESDFTLRWNRSFQGGWFWHADQDEMMFSVPELMSKYESSVGRNSNMLLGIVIDDRGLVPDADVQRITEFGQEIQKMYGQALVGKAGKGKTLSLRIPDGTVVDRVVIQEDITKGERVLAYTLQGRDAQGWKDIESGSNIGHKRIIRFEPAAYSEIRVKVTEAKATPVFKRVFVYSAE